MKKIILFFWILAGIKANAQITEGYVHYQIKVSNNNPSEPLSPMMGNSDVKVYFKNDKVLSEINTSAFIMKSRKDEKGILTLMDGSNGKVYFMKTTAETESEKKSMNLKEPVITYTKEKKMILGYECTKAVMSLQSSNGKAINSVMWYTEKIKNISAIGSANIYIPNSLKGMALEVTVTMGTMQTTLITTEIFTKPVPDALFNLSTAGYTEGKIPTRPRQ